MLLTTIQEEAQHFIVSGSMTYLSAGGILVSDFPNHAENVGGRLGDTIAKIVSVSDVRVRCGKLEDIPTWA